MNVNMKRIEFDFSQVPAAQSYSSIPPGVYVCRVADVREGLSKEQATRWSFRLEVTEGTYAGRTAAWDSLTWSERGIPRLKKALHAFGFDVSGPLQICAQDLLGRRVRAQFQSEEREDPATGQRLERLRVPYLGYERLAEGAFRSAPQDEPIPEDPFEVPERPGEIGSIPGHSGTGADGDREDFPAED
jgi:hypothetical protein